MQKLIKESVNFWSGEGVEGVNDCLTALGWTSVQV